MNPLGWLLQHHTPEVVRREALAQLLGAAAEAFRCDAPVLSGLSSEERLRWFALFTQGQAEEVLRDRCDPEAVQQRLYRNAYRLGRRTGRLLGVQGVRDTMMVGHVLYGILDIEFQGDAGGGILISHCHFSNVYSSRVCRIMSAMDRGLLAGLAGGGQLVFSSRITEGQPFCRAHFALEGARA